MVVKRSMIKNEFNVLIIIISIVNTWGGTKVFAEIFVLLGYRDKCPIADRVCYSYFLLTTNEHYTGQGRWTVEEKLIIGTFLLIHISKFFPFPYIFVLGLLCDDIILLPVYWLGKIANYLHFQFNIFELHNSK